MGGLPRPHGRLGSSHWYDSVWLEYALVIFLVAACAFALGAALSRPLQAALSSIAHHLGAH